MQIGVRQRLIFLTFSGLFVAMSQIGSYRYFVEKRNIVFNARINGELSCKLMSGLAAPYLLVSDITGINNITQNFLTQPDMQELTIGDSSGKPLVHAGRLAVADKRILIGPYPVSLNQGRLGDIRIGAYPADLDGRLEVYAAGVLIEYLAAIFILVSILTRVVSRIITRPVTHTGNLLKDVIDRKDLTRRVESVHHDESAACGHGQSDGNIIRSEGAA